MREGGNIAQAAEAQRNVETRPVSSRSGSGSALEGFSSPTLLAEVLLSTRRMIVEQAGECLLVSFKISS